MSDANLVAYYQLNNLVDAKGSRNLTNNNSVTFTTGKYGSGASFGTPNTNKYLSYTSDNLGIDGGNISISCWIKLLAEPTGGDRFTFVRVGSNTADVGYRIDYVDAATNQLQMTRNRYGVTAPYGNKNVDMGTSSWHHLVLTYNGSVVSGYYDNSAITASGATSGNGITNAFEGVAIGGDVGYAEAIIDDVAVFKDVLTAGEVNTLYKAGSTGGAFVLGLI